MDLNIRRLHREYVITPCIETLERYATETILAGLFVEAMDDNYEYPIRFIDMQTGHCIGARGIYSGTISLMFAVMAHVETQRRRSIPVNGPDCIALWMKPDGSDSASRGWHYKGMVLS